MSEGKSESKSDSAHFQQCSSNFLKWFKSNPSTRLSGKITLADLRARDAGRGVVANSDISADEELFAIPRSLVLQTTNSELHSKIPESFSDLGPWDSLILIIIYEYLRRDASPWFPYLQLLPTTFDTLMFWTPEELSELQGSAVLDKVGKQSAEENWANTILPIMLNHVPLFPISASNAEERQRQLIELSHMAGSMIMAYAFDIDADDSGGNDQDGDDGGSDLTEDDEDNPSKGMVPFADMLNADANRNNARLFHEENFLIMKATKDIKAGEEVFNDYGPLPRSDLLRMYGYLTENYSSFDVVEISADLLQNIAGSSGTDRTYLAEKRNELENLSLIDDAFIIDRAGSDSKLQDLIPVDMRMLIKAFCHPAESFHPSKLSKLVKESGFGISEVSLLFTAVTNRLSDYKTSVQEDSEILEKLKGNDSFRPLTGPFRKRYKMAVQVRKGEKEILHHVMQLCQALLAEQTSHSTGYSAKRKRNENETAPVNNKKTTRV